MKHLLIASALFLILPVVGKAQWVETNYSVSNGSVSITKYGAINSSSNAVYATGTVSIDLTREVTENAVGFFGNPETSPYWQTGFQTLSSGTITEYYNYGLALPPHSQAAVAFLINVQQGNNTWQYTPSPGGTKSRDRDWHTVRSASQGYVPYP